MIMWRLRMSAMQFAWPRKTDVGRLRSHVRSMPQDDIARKLTFAGLCDTKYTEMQSDCTTNAKLARLCQVQWPIQAQTRFPCIGRQMDGERAESGSLARSGRCLPVVTESSISGRLVLAVRFILPYEGFSNCRKSSFFYRLRLLSWVYWSLAGSPCGVVISGGWRVAFPPSWLSQFASWSLLRCRYSIPGYGTRLPTSLVSKRSPRAIHVRTDRNTPRSKSGTCQPAWSSTVIIS